MSTAYLVAGVRTPFGRYGGALAAIRPDDLAAHVLRSLTARAAVGGLGRARRRGAGLRQPGRRGQPQRRPDGRAAGRTADQVPGGTVNRLCGSGLDAVAIAARAVRAGDADLVIAGGVESMTRAPFVTPKAGARLVAQRRDPRHHDRLAAGQPADAGSARHRLDAGDRRDRRRAARHLPGRPGRVRTAFPGADGQGDLQRPAGPGDRPGAGAATPRRPDHGRHRRAPAGNLARRAGPAAPARARRHRHRRQLVRHQRRRGRAAGRLGTGRCSGTGWHRWPGSPPAPRSASSRRSWASARNRPPASCSTGPGWASPTST